MNLKLESIWAWLGLVATLLTLGLSLIISDVQNKIGLWPLLIAVGICLLIFCLAFYVLTRVKPLSTDLLNDIKEHIDRHVDRTSITWCMTSPQLAELERNMALSEVWLVTSDLAEDVPGALFYDVVHANLKKGVRYRYFIPRSLEAEARGMELIQKHKNVGDIEIMALADDVFFLLPQIDYTIYHPRNTTERTTGYMGLPVPCGTEQAHCRMNVHCVDTLVGKLSRILKKSSPGALTQLR